MRIRQLKEEFPWTKKGPRTGLHLSDVIHALDGAMQDSAMREIDEDTRMQFEKGWLWEEALSMAFAHKQEHLMHPKPQVVDEIWGSPDGICYADGITVIEEYKCTSMSPNKSPADMWRWIMQTKGYCYMYCAFKCVFRVMHTTFVPTYRVWELTFTQPELEENWAAILNQKAVMEGEGA